MAARKVRAKVVRLPQPHSCPDPLLNADRGLRVLELALQGLEWRAENEDLDSADVKREVGPLLALVSDIQDAMKREQDGGK